MPDRRLHLCVIVVWNFPVLPYFVAFVESVLALKKGLVLATGFLRRLGGCTQPILAQASDGLAYVVKFTNNVTGSNVNFNEAMGTELYRACGLAVPAWRTVYVSGDFIDRNPDCWMTGIDQQAERIRPSVGLCFASRFLDGKDARLVEILPGTAYCRVRRSRNFWTAWLLDACSLHSDARQAIFHRRDDACYDATFVDHGHMFGGPDGRDTPRPGFARFWDPRIYPFLSSEDRSEILGRFKSFDSDALWRKLETLPEQWVTQLEPNAFHTALDNLSCARVLEETLDLLISSHRKWFEERESYKDTNRKDDIFPALFPRFNHPWQRTGAAEGSACNPVGAHG